MLKNMKYFLVLLFCLSLVLSISSCDDDDDNGKTREESIQDEMATIVEEFDSEDAPFGLLFSELIGDNAEIYVAGEVEQDDYLRIGSLSKVFLSFMVIKEGLNLDATIDSWFPVAEHPKSDSITIRMLLSHTSGIPNFTTFLPGSQEFFPDAIIDSAYNYDRGLDFDPAEMWCYSNTGFTILGVILEQETDTSYDQLLQQHYGTVSPSLYIDDGRDSDFPSSYLNPWPIHWRTPWTAGALIAPAEDVLNGFKYITDQPEFVTMQDWTSQSQCEKSDIYIEENDGLGLKRFEFEGVGEALGHDGNIICRSLVMEVSDTIYYLHTTQNVSNADLKNITERILPIAQSN